MIQKICLADHRVFAIYKTLLGRKTCKYYYETDELLNPRPATQPKKKNRLKVASGPHFPNSKLFFVGWD